jgi:hypothetical protein
MRLRCLMNALRPFLAFAGISCLSPRCLDTFSPFVWRAYLHGMQMMAPASLSQWRPRRVNLRSASPSGKDLHSFDRTIFVVHKPAILSALIAMRRRRLYKTATAVCSTPSTRNTVIPSRNTRVVSHAQKQLEGLLLLHPSEERTSLDLILTCTASSIVQLGIVGIGAS